MHGNHPRGDLGARAGSWTGPFLVSDPATIESIIALREAVWRNEPAILRADRLRPSILRDEHDDHGSHWVILAEGSLVAAARLCIHLDRTDLPNHRWYCSLIANLPAPIASLNKLVVHPAHRGRGLSRRLAEARIAAARAAGAKSIVVEVVPHRVKPMRELGFIERGPSAQDPDYLVSFTLMSLDISL